MRAAFFALKRQKAASSPALAASEYSNNHTFRSPRKRSIMDCSLSLYSSVTLTLGLCIVFSLSAVVLVEHSRPSLHIQRSAAGAQAGHSQSHSQEDINPATARQTLTDAQLFEAVKKHHPLNRLKCGNWVEDYTQLHQNILAGKAPQRYTVMRSKQEFGNGLADRLATSVTIFMYALLTGRAFQFDWDPPPDKNEEAMQKSAYGKFMYFEPTTHLWVALRSDFIDWRYTKPKEANYSLVTMDYNADKETDVYKTFFRETDVSKLMSEYHTVVWHADHALVWAAFNNPFLAPKLKALGLEQETAFACMFDYLYRPTAPVMQLFKPELSVLLDPTILKIGLQIRVGDWQLCDDYTFKPQAYPALFDHYFQCAREIEHELAAPGQRVVYYTLADIPELRKGLLRRHANRILINTQVSVEHIVKTKNTSQHGFLQAAGELWAFSLTSAHVLTRKSGFGKVPAMVNANGTEHIFLVDYPMRFGWFGLDNRKNVGWFTRQPCTTQHATPMSKVCNDFTGI